MPPLLSLLVLRLLRPLCVAAAMNRMLSLLEITFVASLALIQDCRAFVPHLDGRTRFSTRTFVGTSIGGRYYKNNANQTAMDVLESLDFLANIKHRDQDGGGVPLFEATREVVEDEEEDTTMSFKATFNVVEPVTTPVDTSTVMNEREAEFEAAMNGDFDVLHRVSAASNGKKGNKKQNKKKDKQDDSQNTKANTPTGIGGSGGTVYNVNRLKKNLVQEMVKSYKTEMWAELGDPSVDLAIVEDKLANLVQSNAVKCTTDSNLLDGTWTFAFGSRQSAATLMDPNRFDIAARRTTKTLSTAKTPGPFSSCTRTFALENLNDDEDAHVLDRTRYLGGMWTKISRSNLSRLTRTSLMLEPSTQQTYLLGKRIRQKQSKKSDAKRPDLRILYVDNDLCLSATGDLETSPFYVYTKSAAWVGRTQGMKRGARRLFGGLRRVRNSIFNIIFLRRRIRDAVVAKVTTNGTAADKILVDSEDLTVLKLGDLENDANAWEGEEDPFVHLSADERQEQLKKMRVRDVRRAGRKQKRRSTKKGKKSETRKPFKKPE